MKPCQRLAAGQGSACCSLIFLTAAGAETLSSELLAKPATEKSSCRRGLAEEVGNKIKLMLHHRQSAQYLAALGARFL